MNIDEANQRLAQSSSRLRSEIESVTNDWRPDAPPSTVLYAALGRQIAAASEDRDDGEKNRIFDAVEECLVSGDEEVQDAVATGLLEALLHASSAGNFEFRLVASCLGEKSKQYCRAWDHFTGCSTPGL